MWYFTWSVEFDISRMRAVEHQKRISISPGNHELCSLLYIKHLTNKKLSSFIQNFKKICTAVHSVEYFIDMHCCSFSRVSDESVTYWQSQTSHVKLSLFWSSGDTLFLSLVGIPLKHNIIIILNNNLVIHYSLFYSLFVTLLEMMFHSICPMLENAAEHLPISWERCRTELWLSLGRRRTKV